MTHSKTLFRFSLIPLLGVTAWLAFSWHADPLSIATIAELPDAYMEDVHATILDKQGKPSMKIVASKMVHFADNDTSNLTDPQLTIYRKSPEPWLVRANHAKATQGIEQVLFWDSVAIHHPSDANSPETIIKTDSLTVLPNKQTANTLAEITLVQPNTLVRATGMTADINNGLIQLLSKARVEYVPG